MSAPKTELLTIIFTIPLGESPWDLTRVIFHKWLPDGKNEALRRYEDKFSAALWIDQDCADVSEEEIRRHYNIGVYRVKLEVEVRDVRIELSNFIYDERDCGRQIHHGSRPGDQSYEEFRAEYHALARDVLQFTLEMYNRFIEYARIEKAQFWLRMRQFEEGSMSSFHAGSGAMVRCGNRDPVRWATDFPVEIVAVIGAADPYLKESDWQKIREHVVGSSRTTPVREFVSNAMYLAALGYLRSAVAEAASALEIAITNFSRNPDPSKFANFSHATRVDWQNLGAKIDHLGLRVTVNYFLPILLPEELMSLELLASCQRLIELRNAILHHGQKNIDSHEASNLVRDTQKACEILIRLTKNRPSS